MIVIRRKDLLAKKEAQQRERKPQNRSKTLNAAPAVMRKQAAKQRRAPQTIEELMNYFEAHDLRMATP